MTARSRSRGAPHMRPAPVLCAVCAGLGDLLADVCRGLGLEPTLVCSRADLADVRGRFPLAVVTDDAVPDSPFAAETLSEFLCGRHSGIHVQRGLLLGTQPAHLGLQHCFLHHGSSYCCVELGPGGPSDAVRGRIRDAVADVLTMPPYRPVNYYDYVSDDIVHSIVESSQAPVIVFDRAWSVWYANLVAQAVFKRPTHLMRGVAVDELLASADSVRRFREVAKSGFGMEARRIELRMRSRSGDEFDAMVTLNRVYHAGLDDLVGATIYDVTEGKRAGEALRESEERYRSLVEAVPVVLYLAEAGTNRYLLFEGAAEQIFGYRAEDFCSDENLGPRVVFPEDRGLVGAEFERGLASLRPFELEFRIIHGTSGQVRWIHTRVVPVTTEDGKLLRQYGVFTDITERKQAEEALRQSESRLRVSLGQIRKLTADAQRSLEEERARISKELHDELGQFLTVLNIDLTWLKGRTENAEPVVRERVAEAIGLVNRMLDTVRGLSKSLRPPLLDHQGLLDAVRSHVAEFEQRTGIECRVAADPPDLRVGDPLATTAFRIIQEALTNAARHARASRCEVSIRLGRGILEARVRDNGVGAAPGDLAGTKSLGVAGMRERAAFIGGSVRVTNAPGGGVCVTARLPWRPPERRKKKT